MGARALARNLYFLGLLPLCHPLLEEFSYDSATANIQADEWHKSRSLHSFDGIDIAWQKNPEKLLSCYGYFLVNNSL